MKATGIYIHIKSRRPKLVRDILSKISVFFMGHVRHLINMFLLYTLYDY